MDLDDFSLADAFPTWFWGVGVVLVVGISALLILWHLEHPGTSPWENFARVHIPDDVSSLVDAPPADGPGPV